MVEGPGATRNGRKMVKALQRRVIHAEIPTLSSKVAELLVGRCLTEAFSVGKEVFLIFHGFDRSTNANGDGDENDVGGGGISGGCDSNGNDGVGDDSGEVSPISNEIAIRLHFGMNGCLYVGGSGGEPPSVPSWRKQERPCLKLSFGPTILPSNKKRSHPSHYHHDEDGGHCSSKRTKAMTSTTHATLDNYFLTSYPPSHSSPDKNGGTNNNPLSSSLSNQPSPSRISLIIEARRTTISGPIPANTARAKLSRLSSRDVCAQTFDANHVFQTLKLHPNLIVSDAILDQTIFPGVGNIIKVESLHHAKVDPRRLIQNMTDLELRKTVKFCRQFSLSWLNHGRTPHKLVYNQTICGTCRNASVSVQKLGGVQTNNDNTKRQKETQTPSQNTSGHAHMSRVTFWCTICQPSEDIIRRGNQPHTLFPTNHFSPTSLMPQQQPQQPQPPTQAPPPPPPSNSMRTKATCPQHGPNSVILRRVRKPESPNISRIFRICQLKSCPFFEWADLHFPKCACRKVSILKLSKTAKTGGRWFFCCALGGGHGRGRGCQMFEWASAENLERLGCPLSPLL